MLVSRECSCCSNWEKTPCVPGSIAVGNGAKNFPKPDKREDNSYIPQIGMRTNWQSSLQTFVVCCYGNVAVAVPNNVSVSLYCHVICAVYGHTCLVQQTIVKPLSHDRTKKRPVFHLKKQTAYTLGMWTYTCVERECSCFSNIGKRYPITNAIVQRIFLNRTGNSYIPQFRMRTN